MWLSQQAVKPDRPEEPVAEVGRVTVDQIPAGVLTDGESRELAVVSPAGVTWRPAAGQEVLLIRTGDGEKFLVGALCGQSGALAAGEISLCAREGKARITLKNDGKIQVSGDLTVEGDIVITGTVSIQGSLLLNGLPVSAGGLI